MERSDKVVLIVDEQDAEVIEATKSIELLQNWWSSKQTGRC